MEEKKIKEERFTVEICRGLYNKLNKIREDYCKASNGILKISYIDASKILDVLIDKNGGIKGSVKIF